MTAPNAVKNKRTARRHSGSGWHSALDAFAATPRANGELKTEGRPRLATGNQDSSAKLHKHLSKSLAVLQKRFQKRLKECQKKFSEKSVHELRVGTRRLLAFLDLLDTLIPGKSAKAARRLLKARLDAFGELRDMQVQRNSIEQSLSRFPDANTFYCWLRDRECESARLLKKKLRTSKIRKFCKCITVLRRRLKRWRDASPAHTQDFVAALKITERAFLRVVELRRRIRPSDSSTIHDTRVAFKKFRYMVEGLRPVLPEVTSRQMEAMHGYQTMMGSIQDVEVLLASLDKFLRKKKAKIRSMQPLARELCKVRSTLIDEYLEAADQLFDFWPKHRCEPSVRSANIEEKLSEISINSFASSITRVNK